MELKNSEVKLLQERLHDIINNIEANMEIINNNEINEIFLEPIMRVVTNISDKVFIQTKETLNNVKL